MSVDWHFGHALEVRMLVLVTVVCDQPFGIGPLFGVCDNDLAEIYRTSKHPTCPGQISPILLHCVSPVRPLADTEVGESRGSFRG